MVTKYSRRLAESRTGLEGRPKAPRQSGYGAVFSLGEASGNTPNPQHEYNRTTTYTMGRTRNAPRRFVNAILEVVQSEESCPFADPLWDVAIADFYVRGSATRGIATVAHVPTGFMLVLTKPLAKIKFFRFVNAILVLRNSKTAVTLPTPIVKERRSARCGTSGIALYSKRLTRRWLSHRVGVRGSSKYNKVKLGICFSRVQQVC